MPRRSAAIRRALAAAALGALLLALAYQIPAGHSVDIGGYDAAYTQGFYDPESVSMPGQRAYLAGSDGRARWTRAESYLLFPQVGLPAVLTLRARGRPLPAAPTELTLLLNGATPLGRLRLGPDWQEQTFALPGGLLKPEDVAITLRAAPAPLSDDDPRPVGVLLDRAALRSGPPPLTPYPAQLLYAALASGLLALLLQPVTQDDRRWTDPASLGARLRALGARRSALGSPVLVVGLLLVCYRLQPPYPYPLRGLGPGLCAGLAALLALRHLPGLVRRAPALPDLAALGGIALWTGALLWRAQEHVVQALPGVENDFRVFALRSARLWGQFPAGARNADLDGVLRADGFYNLGYPLLLWLVRPLTQDNPFLAGRLVAALSGALLLGAAWWLARGLLGRAWAPLVALALACSPLVVQHALALGTDMPFAALCALALALLLRPTNGQAAADDEGRRTEDEGPVPADDEGRRTEDEGPAPADDEGRRTEDEGPAPAGEEGRRTEDEGAALAGEEGRRTEDEGAALAGEEGRRTADEGAAPAGDEGRRTADEGAAPAGDEGRRTELRRSIAPTLDRSNAPTLVVAGLLAGAAFLVRHPGILLLPLGWLAIWLGRPADGRLARRMLAGLWAFTLAFGLAVLPQVALNLAQTGQPLYNRQVENIWLAVYGGGNWERSGEIPADLTLAGLVLADPARFAGSWLANLRGYIGAGGEDTSEFGRAIQLRLLAFPANWLAVAGLLAWLLQCTDGARRGAHRAAGPAEAPPQRLALLAWLALYVASVTVGLSLDRFFVVLAPVYALAAVWALRRLAARLPRLSPALAGLALALLLAGGFAAGAGAVLERQAPAEAGIVRLVQTTLAPGERLAVRVPARVGLGKYSAIAHLVVPAPDPLGRDALRAAGASYLLWSSALGAPPALGPPVGASGPYTLYRLAP